MTHHILQNDHTVCMVTPDNVHCFQEPLLLSALLHRALPQSGREHWEGGLLHKAIEVLDDKIPGAIL